MYQYRQVIFRIRQGDSNRDIAKSGLMGRQKVSELRKIAQLEGWLTEGPLPEDSILAAHFGQKTESSPQQSLVLPYSQEVKSWHEDGIDGTTIHQALIRKYGFEGSYSSVRRFLQSLKQSDPKATTVLEFEPGEASQVDFGKGPHITDVFTGEILSTWFFVMTLAWSRHQYAELVTNQKVATWLGCHKRAFEFFGGVPQKVIIDNPKCAITRACFRDPQVQRSYAELAEGYGFLISPLPPREPQMKGRVESGVKYVKRNFMPLREFRTLRNANQQLIQWVLEQAGNRIHGTTKQRPLSAFADTEQHMLKPLPDIPPEIPTWVKVKVHGNCHVQFEKAYYSVPFRLVRRELWLRATEQTVKLFKEHQMVALHPRLFKPGDRATIDDHLPPNALAYKMQDPQWCLKQAEEVGPNCQEIIETLFNDHVLDNLRAAQGIIGLGKKYGLSRLEDACQRALFFNNPKYRAVREILKKGLDQHHYQQNVSDRLGDAYTGKGRFSRNIQTLLFQ